MNYEFHSYCQLSKNVNSCQHFLRFSENFFIGSNRQCWVVKILSSPIQSVAGMRKWSVLAHVWGLCLAGRLFPIWWALNFWPFWGVQWVIFLQAIPQKNHPNLRNLAQNRQILRKGLDCRWGGQRTSP